MDNEEQHIDNQAKQEEERKSQHMEEDDDDMSIGPANEDDFIYLDEEQLEAMDRDNILPEGEDEDEFQTINEESLAGEEYEEGQILEQGIAPDDSVVKFGSGQHKDSIFSISCVPREPFNTFISGDCDDKAIVWRIVPDDSPLTEEEKEQEESKKVEGQAPRMRVKSEFYKHLPGHTETVEFIKFNYDGKLLATGGMNNTIRIWNVEKDLELKYNLEDGPSDDLNFLEWHPKGNVLITGGKDKMIWMFNGQNGQFLNCLQGHTADVLSAQFTLNDGGKHIVSSSSDKTIRLWSPMKNTCLQTVKTSHGKIFHDSDINIFA